MSLLPPSFVNLSVFRGVFLWSLYLQLIFSPIYKLPSDYLTRITGCTFVWYNYNFVFTCDNACDLSYVNKLPTFDYIVVGSGAAGSVIANRLATTHRNRKTLLIEASGDPNIQTVPPPLFAFNLNTTSTYNYYAQPSPNYGNAFKNGVGCYAGKTVGGTTAINAMIYACGCDEDYNAWATAANDVSWNYANFLQYIKKPQGLQDPSGSLSSGSCAAYQGTTGPVVLNNLQSNLDTINPLIVAAAAQLGYPPKANSNCGPPFTGFGNIPMSINGGQRQSAARSYITPIAGYSNLYFMRNSTVSKVTTAKNSAGAWYATGVTVLTSRSRCSTINIKASREVIISAGALNSPGILLRSGIGRSADLSSCGIPQVSSVPTGKNLADHVNALQYFTIPGLTATSTEANVYAASQAAEYLSSKSGYFSRIIGLNTAGFINTVNPAANCPNVQYIATRYEQYLPDLEILLKDKWGYKSEFANQLLAANKNKALIQTFTSVLKPKSTGTVTLGHCTNPFVPPIINANYFANPSDLDTIVQGMLFICQLFSTPAAVFSGVQPFTFDIPECNSLTQCTDAYFRCYVKYVTMNEWHPSGTCKMGTSSANGVVNNRLRVFGVGKLRVADASIMPELTSGNTQCPVYAIGEKAADMIIADNP